MAPSDLKLLVEARLAVAIIGRGGGTVRRIKTESSVDHIHLSQHAPGVVDRTVVLTGEREAVRKAFSMVAQIVRAEAGLAAGEKESVRIIVPDADSLIGARHIRQLQQASQAAIEVAPSQGGGHAKERLVTCTGEPAEVEVVAHLFVDAIANRHHQRHKEFLSNWAFETNYNDHFETPQQAYAHLLPLLRTTALRQRKESADGSPRALPPRQGAGKRKRSSEGVDVAPSTGIVDEGSRSDGSSPLALGQLVVYDPYYCLGAVVDALEVLGLARDRVLNANRDFYADVAHGCIPSHDFLVTNPPYSASHKQRLLQYLVGASTAEGAAPFALLMPAWVAATDYWHDFLRQLTDQRRVTRGKPPYVDPCAEAATDATSRRKVRPLERRAGVFYISPKERYAFKHPQSTGHATSPFHSIWFCGGWPTKEARRAALASLCNLRRDGQLEVFRDATMLQRRAHFVPASWAKQTSHSSGT